MYEAAQGGEYGPVPDDEEEFQNDIWRELGSILLNRLKYSRAYMQKGSPEEVLNPSNTEENQKPEHLTLDFSCAYSKSLGSKEVKDRQIVWDTVFPETISMEEDLPESELKEEDVAVAENPYKPENPSGNFYLQLEDFCVRLGLGFERFHETVEKRMKTHWSTYLELKKKDGTAGPLCV